MDHKKDDSIEKTLKNTNRRLNATQKFLKRHKEKVPYLHSSIIERPRE